eukprot:6637465-Prymnesium_polylepis.1
MAHAGCGRANPNARPPRSSWPRPKRLRSRLVPQFFSSFSTVGDGRSPGEPSCTGVPAAPPTFPAGRGGPSSTEIGALSVPQ